MAPTSKDKQPSQQQQTISSFFAKSSLPPKKRKSSPIDLTGDDPDLPLPKKLKSKDIKSSFFPYDADSSDLPMAGPSRSRISSELTTTSSPSAQSSKWRFANADSSCTRQEKAVPPHAARQPFREKLQSRELRKKINSQKRMNAYEEEPSLESNDAVPFEKGASKKKGKNSSLVVGPAGLPCTPLEEEVINFKKAYPATVLLIQVGYKYCFFGEDAKVAGEVLGFGYGQTHNFLRTSFPLQTLKVNTKKLVAAGHKVGVISQVETAALKKAGDNRNTLFDRKLTQLYTPATFVDDLDSQDDTDNFGQTTPPLMCIVETPKVLGSDDKVILGFISVVPSTGDLVYDEFEDAFLRAELETRLTHMRPCELLLPNKMSILTEKALQLFSEHGRVRMERLKEKVDYAEAFDIISEFYEKQSDQLITAVIDLPRQVVVALSYMLRHLSAFGLSNVLLDVKFFTKFTARTHMVLNSSTLNNLEIYRNQTDGTEKGTLFSVVNQTKTMFGKRLLKSWIGRPLVDKAALHDRIEAVEEARAAASVNLIRLRDLLKSLPDLARGLCNIQYGRCAPKELAILLTSFKRIGEAFPQFSTRSEVGCASPIWTEIVYALPQLHSPMQKIISSIDLSRARDDDKENLWTDPDKYSALADSRLAIMVTESELAEELKKYRKRLRMPSLKYASVGSTEFLIEIPKECASIVPQDWSRIGSTTKVLRYHSPEIIGLLSERGQHKETVQAEAQNAYKSFLREIAQQYGSLRDAVNKLAIADCLMSLATVTFEGELCKPIFVESGSLSIVRGRHPVIEQLKSDPFVPNTVAMGGDFPRNLVISGPNMGGKSSIVRMTAVLVILAQTGSYVPAESMCLSVHDTILTRMGASDDLAAGRSTFMVEIAETREIIQSATKDSLVILDELGRGTSTFDGMAIAAAVLEHLAREVKCKTLFITHYPTIARELEVRYPGDIANMHMGFMEDTKEDGQREIHFLYRLTEGISGGSFGIECARLAGVPDTILQDAAVSSERMQRLLGKKADKANARNALRLLQRCIDGDDVGTAPLTELTTQLKIMGL